MTVEGLSKNLILYQAYLVGHARCSKIETAFATALSIFNMCKPN